MASLFDIKCRNCGAPVGYDIVSQSYCCPNCGQVSGIEEVRQAAAFRKLKNQERFDYRSVPEACSCPNCGAEVLYDAGDETQTCSFCGGRLVRKEFETNGDFPEYVIPFVLTKEEAQQMLEQWAKKTSMKSEGRLVLEHLDALEGYYLPYDLVRGPAYGYVVRENVNREFYVRGFIENALINTSRQLDNETLNAAEPFDLDGLKPFEHGYIAGHKVKLADISGAKKERRMLLEAGEDMRPLLRKIFHTDGLRINMLHSDLMEIPVLLPVYVLKIGRRLAVVNGQTGRVAVKTACRKKRSPLWVLEPVLLSLLVLLSLWLAIGNVLVALISSIPLLLSILFQYKDGRFTLFGHVIAQGKQKKASRIGAKLNVEPVITRNPFSIKPVFWENINGVPTDVSYRFYPFVRVLTVTLKTLAIYFLPVLLGAWFHFVFGLGNGFRIMSCVPWFWCCGIFCTVYVFSGIRSDAYEKPYVYTWDQNGRPRLMGPASIRKLPFLECIGVTPSLLAHAGKNAGKLIVLGLGLALILFVSVFSTIVVS